MNSSIILTKINDYLARYRLFVEQENRANRYNINIRAETFFIPILQILFDFSNLRNINIDDKNAAGIDLGDKDKRIAIQVTSDKTSQKVIKTLKQFLTVQLFKDYDHLIIFLIQDRQGSYSNQKIGELVQEINKNNPEFHFDVTEDIVDLAWISERISDYSVEVLQKLLHIFVLEVDGDFISPLSKYPNQLGLYSDVELIGDNRKSTFQEILKCEEDKLLVGQPGIGKTFIIQKIAKKKKAYFITDESKYNLARAIDIVRPEILFVDDAHKSTDLLAKVCQIRDLMDEKFQIIATSWPMENLARVKQVGNYQEDQIINLKLFTKNEMAELLAKVIELEKLNRQYGWEQLIIDYSNGLPGLAVTLLDTCIKTGGKEVFEGINLLTFLADISLETRSSIEWIRTRKLLAYLSFFGGSGLRLAQISQIIELPTIEIDTLLESYHYSGIITEEGGRFRVRPRALRAVLVKREFLTKDYQKFGEFDRLINSVESVGDILDVILDAIRIGGTIPRDYLYLLMSKTTSEELWERFYFLYPEMIEKGISDFRNTEQASIKPGLANTPERILPIVFEVASADKRPLHSYPDHVLRKLEEWVQLNPTTYETIKKRRTILNELTRFADQGGDPETIMKVVCILMSPAYEAIDTPPGSGNLVNFGKGIFSIDILRSFNELWGQVYELLSQLPVGLLSDFINSLFDWVQPSRIVQGIPDSFIESIRKIAEPFVRDTGELVKNHPALMQEIKRLFAQMCKKLNIKCDISSIKLKIFNVLFPPRDDYIKFLQEGKSYSIDDLAQELLLMDEESVLENIAWVRREASLIPNLWPNFIPNLFSFIAKNVENPIAWYREMYERDLVTYTLPFVHRAVDDDVDGWEGVVKELFEQEETLQFAIQVVLGLESPSDDLLQTSLKKLDNMNPDWLTTLCAQNLVSEKNISRLLNHDSREIALAVAIGEWHRNPKNEVRENLKKDWNRVISEARTFHCVLLEIFKENSQFVLDWTIDAYFSICDKWTPEKKILFKQIVELLKDKERTELLKKILDQNRQSIHEIELVKTIVNNSVTLYKFLLENTDVEQQKFYLLAPLNRTPDEEDWDSMVSMAIKKGISTSEIIDITLQPPYFEARIGLESELYKRYVQAFEELTHNENELLMRMANDGLKTAKEKMRICMERELDRDIYGWER